VSQQIAQALWETQAVFLRPEEPFTWASGIKSPIYCDNRLLISQPAIRRAITDAFVKLVAPIAPQVIAGTATAGIPWAAWLADRLELPMIYVRSSAKSHGRQNLVEGALKEGQTVVVIEDLVSTGQSSLAAVEALQAAGAKVLAVTSVFHYNFAQAHDVFASHEIPCNSLCTLDDMLVWTQATNKLSAQQTEDIRAWRQSVNFP
jgi:orotate phosphoribosyltransferase